MFSDVVMLFTGQWSHERSRRNILSNKMIEPYYINYGELDIVKNKIDKIIPKIKKIIIQLQSRDIITFLNSKYIS